MPLTIIDTDILIDEGGDGGMGGGMGGMGITVHGLSTFVAY
jgi:hypothetical protein